MSAPYFWFLAFVFAVAIVGGALVGATAIRDALDNREAARRRAQQQREVTPEWLAVLAATEPTPVYDRLVCEQIEREEWSA